MCSRIRKIVDSYIRENGGIPGSVEIEIHSSGFRTFENFLKLDFSASRFYICNLQTRLREFDEPTMFEEPAATIFFKRFGSQIKYLRVQQMYTNPTSVLLQLFETLSKLKHLEIESVGKFDKVPGFMQDFSNSLIVKNWFKGPQVVLPNTFKNLTVIKISQTEETCWPVSDTRFVCYNISILKTCTSLRTFTPGYYPKAHNFRLGQLLTNRREENDFRLYRLFSDMWDYLQSSTEQVSLKYIDFRNITKYCNSTNFRNNSRLFLDLCAEFFMHDIRIKNIPAKAFSRFKPAVHDPEIISDVVLSMHGLHRSVLGIDLPLLRDLSISTMEGTSFRGAQTPYSTTWPRLKKLEIFIQSEKVWTSSTRAPIVTVSFLLHLLLGIRRPRLRSLALQFKSRMMDTLSANPATFPCPKIEEILINCENLVKIEIRGWPCKDNIKFSKLWEGLPFLEEVILAKCKYLGDVAFTGTNLDEPSFLKLKSTSFLWSFLNKFIF